MSALTVNPAYTALLATVPPRVIRTDAENEAYLSALHDLHFRHDPLTPEESELADLLTLLVESFEDKQYALPRASPLDALQFLMEQHAVTIPDLALSSGGTEALEAVLSGTKPLTAEQIRHLTQRFHVSADLFI